MNTKLALTTVVMLAMGGCHDDNEVTLTSVSGFTFDADLLLGAALMHGTDWTPQMIFDFAKNANAPVYGRYADGTKTDVAMSDAMGNYTIMAKQGTTITMVADGLTDASHNNLATLTPDPITVGTTPVANTVAHACTSNPYSVPSGIAMAANIAADQLQDKGILLFGGSPPFTPPYAKIEPNLTATLVPADPSVTEYAGTDPTTTPITFAVGTTSPIGAFGFTKEGLPPGGVMLTIELVDNGGKVAFANQTFPLIPGLVTFGGIIGTCANGMDGMMNCN